MSVRGSSAGNMFLNSIMSEFDLRGRGSIFQIILKFKKFSIIWAVLIGNFPQIFSYFNYDTFPNGT